AIAWPMVEEAAIACEPELVTMDGLVPIGSQEVAVAPRPMPRSAPAQHVIPWVVGVAAIVLLTFATFSVVREPAAQKASVVANAASPVEPVEEDLAPVAAVAPVPTRADAPGPAATAGVRPRRVASHPAGSRPAAARPAPPRKQPSRARSFFRKELFRIV